MSLSSLNYNETYARSVGGILKMICLLCQLTALLSICCSPVPIGNARGIFYICIALLSIICTGGLLLTHLFSLWQSLEIIYEQNIARCSAYASAALAFLTFSAAAFALTLDAVSYTIVAFFGFLACCCHMWEVYVSYSRCLQRDAATQTEHVQPV